MGLSKLKLGNFHLWQHSTLGFWIARRSSINVKNLKTISEGSTKCFTSAFYEVFVYFLNVRFSMVSIIKIIIYYSGRLLGNLRFTSLLLASPLWTHFLPIKILLTKILVSPMTDLIALSGVKWPYFPGRFTICRLFLPVLTSHTLLDYHHPTQPGSAPRSLIFCVCVSCSCGC